MAAIGRKLYVIVLFFVGLSYLVWCRFVLVCGRQSLIFLLYIMLVCVIMVLIPLLSFLTWMTMYCRKVYLSYRTTIMIVSGYTLARNSSMEKPDRRECK